MSSGIVKLDVGGVKYKTTKQTLLKYPNSMLSKMFSSDIPPQFGEDGYVFLDANGEMFSYILQFLRNGSIDLPDDFRNEKALKSAIQYFQILEMLPLLEDWLLKKYPPKSKRQLLDVLAYIDCQNMYRWVYAKEEGTDYFTPVLTDEQGKDVGRSVWLDDEEESNKDSISVFRKLIKQEDFNSHVSVLTTLSLLNVKDFDKPDFDGDSQITSYCIKLYEAK